MDTWPGPDIVGLESLILIGVILLKTVNRSNSNGAIGNCFSCSEGPLFGEDRASSTEILL